MNCSQVQEKLSCYLDGVLDEATLEAIEAHLESCEDCCRELAALSSVVNLASEVADVEPPAYLSMAIRDAVAREQATGGECAAYLPMLSEYIDGELDEAERCSVEAHVASCEYCAEEVAMLRQTVAAMSLAAEVDPPAALRERIAAATTRRRTVAPVAVLREWVASLFTLPKLGWAAGTAGAAAAVAGAWILMPNAAQEKTRVVITPKTPPSVAAKAPEPAASDPASVTTPSEKAIRVAVAKAAKKSKSERADIAAVTPVETPAPIVEITPVPKKSTVAAHHPAVEKPEVKPVAEPVAEPVKTEMVASKPVEKPDEKAETPKDSVIKIAVVKAKVEYPPDYFDDAKLSAQMRQRMDKSLKVDVLNSRF